MRTTTLLLLALLSTPLARAGDEPPEVEPPGLAKRLDKVFQAKSAKALAKLSTPAFRKLLGTRRDPLARLRVEGNTLRIDRPELTINGQRALLRCRLVRGGEAVGDGVWLKLERVGGRWGLAGVIDVGPPATIWLAGGLKGSRFATPRACVDALAKATEDHEREAARACVTEQAWNEPGDTVGSLYRQCVRKRMFLQPATPRVQGKRAVITVDLTRSGKLLDRVFLYMVQRGEGWLVGGIDEDERRGARFLAGKEQAKPWPRSPSELVSAFVQATRGPSQVQSRALWTDVGWEARGEKLYRQRIAPRKTSFRQSADARTQGEHAYAAVEQRFEEEVDLVFYLLMVRTPAGWRIDGWTKREAQAREHLSAK